MSGAHNKFVPLDRSWRRKTLIKMASWVSKNMLGTEVRARTKNGWSRRRKGLLVPNKGFSEMKSLPGLTPSWTRMEMPVLTLRRFLLGSFPAMRRLPPMRWITCSSRWNTANQIFELSIFYALSKRWTICSLALTKMETNSWLSKRFLCSLRITVFSNHTTANSPPLFNNQLCVCIRTCVCSCILICIFFFKFHTSISRFSTTTTCLWDPRQPIMGTTCITFTSSFFLSASSISTLWPTLIY